MKYKLPPLNPNARKKVNVVVPMAGLDRAWGYQNQPPYSLPDALNCRARDVMEQRQRIGVRGGHAKVFAQLLGSAVPVESFTTTINASKDGVYDSLYHCQPRGVGFNTTVGHATASTPIDPCAGTGTTPIIGKDLRCLLHFDLSSIPTGATIVQATMKLYITVKQGAGGHPMWIRRITDASWVESEFTWDNKNSTTAWASPGGDFTTDLQLSFNSPTSLATKSYTGMEPLTVDAMDNRSKQLSLMLRYQTEPGAGDVSDNWFQFRSWNLGTGSGLSSTFPRITITYTVPA